MKRIVIDALMLISLFIIANAFAGLSPEAGQVIGISAVVVGGIAIIKPLPQIGLGHRGFTFFFAILMGAVGLVASQELEESRIEIQVEAARVAGLRVSDPDAYLAELRSGDEEHWLSELEVLRPDAFQAEMDRRAAKAAEKAAEKAAAILESIRRGHWVVVRSQFERLRGDDLRAAYGDLEAAALSGLQSLPETDVMGREIAFEFLSDLRPGNAEYRVKAERYRIAADARRRAAQATADALAEQERAVEEHCKGRSNAIEALVVSQLNYIEPKLRSPSTADFPYYSDDGVSVTILNECTFVVRTYVDAQNGFGAIIRTRFLVKLQRDVTNPDAWRLIDLFTLD